MAKQKQNPKRASDEPVGKVNDAFDQAVATWLAPRYLRYERNWLWFLIVFGSCGSLAVYGYLTGSWTMAAVFALVPFILILEHRKKPDTIQVTVSEYGIRFGNIAIPFSSMLRFWVLHNPPFVNELHLETQGKMHKEFVIQLGNHDPTQLRQYLATQIPEAEGKNLSLSEATIRFLRLN